MVSMLRQKNEYDVRIILNERDLKKKMSFLNEIMELEKNNKISIERNVCGIDNLKILIHTANLHEDGYDLIRILKELSGKYGRILVSVSDNLYKDNTSYNFFTGKMMEREYYSRLA